MELLDAYRGCRTGSCFLLWRGTACVAIEAKASSRYRVEFTKGLRALQAGMAKIWRRCGVVYLGSDRMRTAEDIDILPLADSLQELSGGQLFPA